MTRPCGSPRLTPCALVIRALLLVSCVTAPADAADPQVAAEPAMACEADLDGDGHLDAVVMLGSGKQSKVIALRRQEWGYKAYLVTSGKEGMRLSCGLGTILVETRARGTGTSPIMRRTRGAYILLKQPEGAAVAYYWDGARFAEVWVAD